MDAFGRVYLPFFAAAIMKFDCIFGVASSNSVFIFGAAHTFFLFVFAAAIMKFVCTFLVAFNIFYLVVPNIFGVIIDVLTD